MELKTEIENLKKILASATEKLKSAPPGNLHIQINHNSVQYFNYDDGRRHYIPVKQIGLIKELAQKKYENQIVCLAEKELKNLLHFERCHDYNCIARVYESFHPKIRELIVPYDVPDDELYKQWKQETFRQKEMTADSRFLITANGDKVRSKSEAIIADKLFDFHIPYRYEALLHVLDTYSQKHIFLYPDFTIFNIKTRETLIWEHFGLMSDPLYASNAISKINLYNQNGYIQGKNLICTFETADNPLQPALVINLIRSIFQNLTH